MSKYKVYTVNISRMGLAAVIITTASKNPGGYWRAESFLIVPDDNCTLYARSLTFDFMAFKESSIELNEKFMFTEAQGQALINLRLHLTKIEQNGVIFFHEEPRMIEDARLLLAHYWVRGHCASQLEEIGKKTDCIPLEEIIHHIMKLPALKITDL